MRLHIDIYVVLGASGRRGDVVLGASGSPCIPTNVFFFLTVSEMHSTERRQLKPNSKMLAFLLFSYNFYAVSCKLNILTGRLPIMSFLLFLADYFYIVQYILLNAQLIYKLNYD